MTAPLESDPQGFSHFAQRFFAGAAPEDLKIFSKDALVGIARLFWHAAQERAAKSSYLRVFNPTAERDGFAAPVSFLVTINDDKPFLVDSILSELAERSLPVKAVFHPIFRVKRDKAGRVQHFVFDGADSGTSAESMICVAFSRTPNEATLGDIEGAVGKVLRNVSAAVADWPSMLSKLDESIADLWQHPPQAPREEIEESLAFLKWLKDHHFTFLGCRDYTFEKSGAEEQLVPVPESGLGLLRDPDRRVIRKGSDRASLTREVRAFLMQPSPLILTKSIERSPVHRRVQEDYIGVKRFDASGKLTGERRFVGLFTSAAYSESPRAIPFLRRKVANVMARAGFAKGSHNAKALAVVLETFQRDELFQISEEDLLRIAPALAHFGDRPHTKAFVRFDTFDRFASALVYFPADKFRGGLVRTIGQIFKEEIGGQITGAYPRTEEGQMTRILYTIAFPNGRRSNFDEIALQVKIENAVRLWSDDFADALAATSPEQADAIFARYGSAFSEGYREAFTPFDAMLDIAKLEETARDNKPALRLSSGASRTDGVVQFKIYQSGGGIELSDLLPVLENFGLRAIEEVNYPVKTDEAKFTIHDLRLRGNLNPERESAMRVFEEAFLAVWNGEAESDAFNKLTLLAEMPWREVAILRSIAKFLRQAAFPFSQALMEDALSRNPRIAAALVRLFHARFDPDWANREEAEARINIEVDEALAKVPSLDDDRIIRRFRNVMHSTLRTNYFQTDAGKRHRPTIAFKLDSAKIEDLPLPRPMVEIFVYSPDVEGVHLRFGKVARGGIRWSDRREDFRTEVLGLVKAQQVKNAVIVPVGSKGGFFPKKLPPISAGRDAWQAAGVEAYKTYIASLLDVTDNIAADGRIVPPREVVRHDQDDPYLVVAADKGTATFSDIANGISVAYKFWLGDAFASGGSAGYDHKKMGITAKGAWEAVKRHFREIGIDIQTTPFSVIGVGDMSGDVFGNGMLLSKATRLVAAFDHRDIFLDPDPDIAGSFAERERLFALPRSSWADYDQSKISRGGGVYSRSMKRIPLSPEVRALTGLTGDHAEPAELMRALVKAPVDLLWFGGIGTFVKSSVENNADVGDKANDLIRADGRDIRAKVVGEGANLGCTQAGRIEYARASGRINTDAIDNSAGVDTSDHEVNLKILLNASIGASELKTNDRDALLASMTDEVGHLVLADNYNQTLALSIAQSGGYWESDAYGRFMRALERDGRLNRKVEGLPSNDELRERANRQEGLTRPELAVLLAYAKLSLFDEINASPLADDPFYVATLKHYFPQGVGDRFPKGLTAHRLKREIIATVLGNDMINRGGPVFMHRLKEASASQAWLLTRAYTMAVNAFSFDKLADRINALDNQVVAEVQVAMHAKIAQHLLRQTLWFWRNVPQDAPIAETIKPYKESLERLRGTFSTLVSEAEHKEIETHIREYKAEGVPDDLAEDIAALRAIGATPDIARLSTDTKKPLDMVAGAYFCAARTIGIDRLRLAAERMNLPEHWDRLAMRRQIDDLLIHQRELASRALKNGHDGGDRSAGSEAVDAWAERHREKIERVGELISDLERAGTFTISRLTIAASQIRDLLDA